MTAHTRRDADELRAAGADVVLEPFSTAAAATSGELHRLLTGEDGRTDPGAGLNENRD